MTYFVALNQTPNPCFSKLISLLLRLRCARTGDEEEEEEEEGAEACLSMLPAGSFFSVSCFPRAFCFLLFLVQDDFELLVVKRFVTNTLCFVMFCLRGCRGGELRMVSFLSALFFLLSI